MSRNPPSSFVSAAPLIRLTTCLGFKDGSSANSFAARFVALGEETDVPEAAVGDEVVLIGKQGDEEITLEEVAEIRDTDLHGVCQSVRNHIPWLYMKNKKPYKLKTILGESML